MASSKRDSLGSDIVGFGRLAVDAMFGLTSVVESMHGTIADHPLPFGGTAKSDTRGITRLVYQSIRAVTHSNRRRTPSSGIAFDKRSTS